MKPHPKLIHALRAIADYIEESPNNYDWWDCSKCNVGLIASILLDKPFNENAFAGMGSWAFCFANRKSKFLPIFSALEFYGLETVEDFAMLEYFEGPILEHYEYDFYEDVAIGFRKLANHLEGMENEPPTTCNNSIAFVNG